MGSSKDDVEKLIHDINEELGSDSSSTKIVTDQFKKWWPELEDRLNRIPPNTEIIEKRPLNDMVEEMLDIVRSISREFEVGTTRHEKVLGRHVGFLPAGRSEIAQLVEKFSENDLEGVLNQMVKDGVAKFEGYDVIIRDPAGRPKKESDR